MAGAKGGEKTLSTRDAFSAKARCEALRRLVKLPGQRVPGLQLDHQVGSLKAYPAPQVTFLRVFRVVVVLSLRRIDARGISTCAILRRNIEAKAVKVGARDGAQCDAQGQGITAACEQFQGMQRHVHIGLVAGEST